MDCRRCASSLERPGDYCLACNTSNADAVLVEIDEGRASVVSALEGDVVSERVVKTRSHEEDPEREVALRNLVGRAADEVRRKRPDEVYVRGDRSMVSRLRRELAASVSRVADDASYDEVFGDADEALDVVEADPADKIGGSHSTLIGGRDGRRAVRQVAGYGHVKKDHPGTYRRERTGFAGQLRGEGHPSRRKRQPASPPPRRFERTGKPRRNHRTGPRDGRACQTGA